MAPRNKLCDKCEIKFETKISLYDHQRHVHIPGINGNYCNKTLENLDRLEETIEKEYIPFVTTLRALKVVKDSCFGPKLHENWKENIQNFEKAWFDIYIEFDIYFSNKCHVIIEHIPQVIERTGKSLYLSSEQVVEATHAKFAVFWERYKVNNLEKETHGTC